VPKLGYLGPPNKLNYLEGSLRTWRIRHLNRFLIAPPALFLKENIEERIFLNFNPVVGIQPPLDLSPISMGLTQKTGIFVPQRDVSQNLRMHKLVENSGIGPFLLSRVTRYAFTKLPFRSSPKLPWHQVREYF